MHFARSNVRQHSTLAWIQDQATVPQTHERKSERLCCAYAVSLPTPISFVEPGPTNTARPKEIDEPVLQAEVLPHVSMLRQVAQRILRCPEQADDAVQDALVALWKRAERPPELRGWLVKTVIHRSLHRRRTELRRQRWEDEAAVALDVTCPLCDPEEEFARREWLEVVEAALSSLASEQQEVIRLRSHGLEYDEIAHALGVPIGTVRSRLNRARRALRSQLAADEL